MAEVEVEGAPELRRTLKRMGADMGDLTALHRQVAGIVVGPARSLAPHASGRLAGSIRPRATRAAARIAAGGARVPYARVQEYGWPARGIVARRYMERALATTRDAVVATYRTGIAAIVAKYGPSR